MKIGDMVEYDRQRGAPPVIAELLAIEGDTVSVLAVHVLNENNVVMSEYSNAGHKFTLPVSEVRPARQFRHTS